MADGSIRIDTQIDNSKAEKGIKSLKSQVAELASEYKKQGLSASEAFKKAWNEVEKGSETSSKKASSNLDSIKTSLTNIGNTALSVGKNLANGLGNALKDIASITLKTTVDSITAATTALMAMATYAIKAGSDFEAAMSKVSAISGVSKAELDQLTSKAKEMGASTKFSATESAEAFQYMAMAGWKTADMLNGIDGIMNLAASSGEDLASVSDIVTDALTAFGLQAKDSSHFADVLAKTASSANTNIGMMGYSFKYAAPLAGALNYSIEDVGLALGLLANSSIKSETAGTALRTMFSKLQGTFEVSGKKLGKFVIETENADGSVKPLRETLISLREAFALATEDTVGLTEGEQLLNAESLVGREAMSGLLAIVNASDEDFNKLAEAIDNASGAAEQQARIMEDNLQGQITSLKSAVEGLGIEFYQSIDNPLTEVVRNASTYIRGLVSELQKVSSTVDFSSVQNQIIELVNQGKSLDDAFTEATKGLSTNVSLEELKTKLEELGNQGYSTQDALAKAVSGIRAEVSFEEINLRIEELMQQNYSMKDAFIKATEDINTNVNFDEVGTRIEELMEQGYSLEQAYTKAIDEIQSERVLGLLPEMFSEVLTKVVNKIAEFAPELMDTAVKLVKSFVESLTADKETITNSAKEIVTTLIDGITEILPEIIDLGGEIILSLVKGIIDNSDEILEKLEQTIRKIIDVICEKLGVDAQPIQEFLDSIINAFSWIIDNGESIVPIIVAIVAAMAGFKIESVILGLVKAFKSWKDASILLASAQKALNLVMNANPFVLIATVIALVVTALITLWNTNEDFRNAVTRIWNSVLEFLSGAIDSIVGFFTKDIPNAIENVVTFFKELPSKMWKVMLEVIDNIVQWVSDLKSTAQTEIPKFIDSIVEKIKELPDKFLQVGKDIVTGLWDGITGMGEWIGSKVTGFFDGVVSKAKGVLDEHSPSKVFAKIGEFVVLGFNQGIESQKSATMNTISEFSNGSIETFNTGIETLKEIVKLGYETLGEIIKSALERQAEEQYKIQYEAMSKQEKLYQETLENRTKSLEAEIKAIEENLKEQEKLQKEKDKQAQLSDKAEAIRKAKNSKDRAKAQKEYDDLVYKQMQEAEKEKQQLLKESLENELKLIKEADSKRREAINDLGDAIITALKNRYEKEKEIQSAALDEQIEQVKSALDAEKELHQKAYEESKEQLEKEKELQLKALEQKIEATKEAYDNEKEQRQKSYEAEKDSLEKQKELQLKAIEDEIEAIKKATDEKIAQYDREYAAKLKLIDEDEYNQVSQLQAQIDELNALTEAEEEAEKEREKQQKIFEAQNKVAQAKDDEARLEAQQALNELLAKYERESILKQRKEQQEQLKQQIKDIKNNNSEKKDLLKEEFNNIKANLESQREIDIASKQDEKERLTQFYADKQQQLKNDFENWKTNQEKQNKIRLDNLNKEKEQINEQFKFKQDSLQKEYETTKQNLESIAKTKTETLQAEKEETIKHFDELLSEENLNAEARKMIIQNNQDEIISLLESYNSAWLTAGQDFADSLIQGLTDRQQSVQSKVNELLSLVDQANQAVLDISNAQQEQQQLENNNKSNSSNTASKSYTVKKGDTLSSIANKTGVSVSELADLNDIKNVDKILEGQILELGDKVGEIVEKINYTVNSFDANLKGAFVAASYYNYSDTNYNNANSEMKITVNNYQSSSAQNISKSVARDIGKEVERELRNRGVF